MKYVIVETDTSTYPRVYKGGNTEKGAEKVKKQIQDKWDERDWYKCELFVIEIEEIK